MAITLFEDNTSAEGSLTLPMNLHEEGAEGVAQQGLATIPLPSSTERVRRADVHGGSLKLSLARTASARKEILDTEWRQWESNPRLQRRLGLSRSLLMKSGGHAVSTGFRARIRTCHTRWSSRATLPGTFFDTA